jgi:hypothetical protein
MRWIRSNVRIGAWCALAALVLQLVLSFAHVHLEGGTATAPGLALAASPVSDTANPPSNDEPKGHADDFCAICALIQLAGTMTPATAPVLELAIVFSPVPFAASTDRDLAAVSPLSFRARGPPLA